MWCTHSYKYIRLYLLYIIYAENTLVFSHDFLKAHINSLYNKLAQYEYTLVLRQLYSIKMQSAHTHTRVPFSMSHVSVVWSTRWGMHSIVALGISEHWGGHFCTFERYHSDTIWCFFQPHWPNVTAFSFYISMSVLICALCKPVNTGANIWPVAILAFSELSSCL